jgi:tetratricopeptide (TPR) repeat protein
MKHISSFLKLITFTFLLSSCSDILDLEPAQSLSNEVALSSDEGVKQVLNSAYDELSLEDLYGGNIMRNAELYGGEGQIIWLGTFEAPQEIFNRDILVVNVDVEYFWNEAYNAINICNNVLTALNVVDEDDRARIEGEARFIRGALYFELARYFGQQYKPGDPNQQPAVPIVLTPSLSSDDNADVSRNTVGEVYAQAIEDLTAARDLLPEKNTVYATTYAASAMLARIYLQQENYEGALAEADRVISSNRYKLVPDYEDVFAQDDNTTEDIFAIQVSNQDGGNAMNTYFSTALYGGRGDIQIEQQFYDSYAADDLRSDLYYKVGGKWRTGKFNNEFGNVTIIRLAEMHLIRAECNQRLGSSVGATPVDDYNLTHTRAGLEPAVSVTLDEILAERQFELAHEGFRVFDIKRLRGVIGTMPYDDVKMVYPIPQREIQVNPNLEQNPGY